MSGCTLFALTPAPLQFSKMILTGILSIALALSDLALGTNSTLDDSDLYSSLFAAHSGTPATGHALARRRAHNLHLQRSLAKRCASTLWKVKAKRQAKRSLRARSESEPCSSTSAPALAAEVTALHFDSTTSSSSNSTEGVCILTPEVTQGPYHILGELVRQNITEDQGESSARPICYLFDAFNAAGVPLEIDVDFIDIDTCEVVPVSLIDRLLLRLLTRH